MPIVGYFSHKFKVHGSARLFKCWGEFFVLTYACPSLIRGLRERAAESDLDLRFRLPALVQHTAYSLDIWGFMKKSY